MTENIKGESKMVKKLMMQIADSRFNEDDYEEFISINNLTEETRDLEEDFMDLSIIYPEKSESFISLVRRIVEAHNPYDITFEDEVKDFIKKLFICNLGLFKNVEQLLAELYLSKDLDIQDKIKKLMNFMSYFYNICFQNKVLSNEKLADLCGESFKIFAKIYICENSQKNEGLTEGNFSEMTSLTDIIIGLIKLNIDLEIKYKKSLFQTFFKSCKKLVKRFCCKK